MIITRRNVLSLPLIVPVILTSELPVCQFTIGNHVGTLGKEFKNLTIERSQNGWPDIFRNPQFPSNDYLKLVFSAEDKEFKAVIDRHWLNKGEFVQSSSNPDYGGWVVNNEPIKLTLNTNLGSTIYKLRIRAVSGSEEEAVWVQVI
jgi:hypothetical protein